MPLNKFSVGKDIAFSVIGPNGLITLNGVTNYSIKPMYKNLDHKGIDGVPQFAAIPDGWEINIKLDRQDNTLDVLIAALEASYFAGADIVNGTVSENITETTGAVSSFQYTGASLVPEDMGDYRGDAFVPQSLRIRASRRLNLS